MNAARLDRPGRAPGRFAHALGLTRRWRLCSAVLAPKGAFGLSAGRSLLSRPAPARPGGPLPAWLRAGRLSTDVQQRARGVRAGPRAASSRPRRVQSAGRQHTMQTPCADPRSAAARWFARRGARRRSLARLLRSRQGRADVRHACAARLCLAVRWQTSGGPLIRKGASCSHPGKPGEVPLA